MIKIPAQLQSISTLSDGACSVRLHTQELRPEEKVELMNHHNQFGWFLFDENEIDDSDIPSQPAQREGKTPSQRLRGVLFLIHKQKGGNAENFEDFYIQEYEKIITHYKAKLDI